MAVCGVRPRLRQLSNGVIACSYGRVTSPPSLGDQIIFSTDGGQTWTDPTVLYHGPSTGYTCMLEIRPNELLLVYDTQCFGWVDRPGVANAIMSVTIGVERT